MLRVKFLDPFLAGNCAEKPILIVGANLKGGSEDSTEMEGKSQKMGR